MPDAYHLVQENTAENTAERTEEIVFSGDYYSCRDKQREKIREERQKLNRVKIYSQEDSWAIMLPGDHDTIVPRYYHIVQENDYAESIDRVQAE